MTMGVYPGGPPAGAIVADENRRRDEANADAARSKHEQDRMASLLLSTHAEEAELEPVRTWAWRDDVAHRGDDQWTWHDTGLDCSRVVTLVASIRVATLTRAGDREVAEGKCWMQESVLAWGLIDSISGDWWSVYASGELTRSKPSETMRLSTPMGGKLQLALKLTGRGVAVAEDDLEGPGTLSNWPTPLDRLPTGDLLARNVEVALLLRQF